MWEEQGLPEIFNYLFFYLFNYLSNNGAEWTAETSREAG
jgi:hypothetical protein